MIQKRLLIAWFVTGLFFSLWGLITCGTLFRWVYFIDPSVIYNTGLLNFSFQWASLAVLGNFIFAAVFVMIYSIIHSSIKAKGIKKGLIFGLLLWIMGSFLFFLRVSINLKPFVVFLYWTINDFFVFLICGVIISLIYEKKDKRQKRFR